MAPLGLIQHAVDLNNRLINTLPNELKDAVINKLPSSLRNEVRGQPLPWLMDDMPYSQHADPSIPPKSGTPILKLPTELRAKIFKYLLPSKRNNIAPLAVTRKQSEVENRRHETSRRRNLERAGIQWQAQQNIIAQGTFNFNNLGNVAPVNNPPPQQPMQGAIPPQPGANPNPTGVVQPPPTANPTLGWTVAAQNNQVGTLNNHFGQPTNPGNPFNAVGGPVANQHNGTVPIPLIPPQQHPPAMTAALLTYGAATAGDSEDDEDIAIQRALLASIEDQTPEKMTIALLTTHSIFCCEVSTILYEEYVFEMHIHPNGIDFLHFPHIPTLENCGREIENTMGAFKTKGHFCFQRMRHLEFVFWGGDPKDRTAGWRMRQSARKLVDMLRAEKEPLHELCIRFKLEEAGHETEFGETNEYFDELGTFWKNRRDNRARIAARDVSMIELVCSPFKMLRGVGEAKLTIPDDLVSDSRMLAYTEYLERTVKSEELFTEDVDQYTLEQMMMDAVMDYDIKHSAIPSEGYYNTAMAETSVPATGAAAIPLLTEDELEEDDQEQLPGNVFAFSALSNVVGQNSRGLGEEGDNEVEVKDEDEDDYPEYDSDIDFVDWEDEGDEPMADVLTWRAPAAYSGRPEPVPRERNEVPDLLERNARKLWSELCGDE